MTSIPEVREDEASPEIAAIYDEYKRATGLQSINLIYRHLATLPDALPWVWGLLRGPILAGFAEGAANRIASELIAPVFSISIAVRASDAGAIRMVLDVYNRANLLNLVCLTAVLAVMDTLQDAPRSTTSSAIAAEQTHGSARPQRADQGIMPPLPKPASLPVKVAALVQSLAALHPQAVGAGITPSLYLHLAHWPEFLGAARQPLAASFADGSVERARSRICRLAAAEAVTLTAAMVDPASLRKDLEPVRRALETFTQHVIPEMIVVGHALRAALSKGAG